MTTLILATTILALYCTLASSHQHIICLTVCHCSEDDPGTMDCSRNLLSIVPPVNDWPSNITFMDLSSNNISSLSVGLSQDTLESFDLSHNNIASVVQSAFDGLSNLRHLDLSYNVIEKFEDNGFYGIDRLETLNISGNKIKLLPDGLFNNFYNLEELILSDNPLVHVEPLVFNRLNNLRRLDLSNIGAYALPPNSFHLMDRLEFLDLSTNEFHTVPTDAIRSAKGLMHLRFNENPVEQLHKSSFVKMDSLVILELSYMDQLKEVGSQTFKGLNRLSLLEMKYNRQLNFIHHNAFEGLFTALRPVLDHVNLEQNSLSMLANGTFDCARMKMFNLQRNPWFCDCRLKWIKKCRIQPIYAADLKCKGPGRLTNALITNIEDEDFRCDHGMASAGGASLVEEVHHDRVVRSVSLAVACMFLVAVALGIAFVLKRKSFRQWWKASRKGPGAVYYVRAHAQPREL